MRKYGAYLVEENVYGTHERPLPDTQIAEATVDPITGVISLDDEAVGVKDGLTPAFLLLRGCWSSIRRR
jgi:hypothetical protein